MAENGIKPFTPAALTTNLIVTAAMRFLFRIEILDEDKEQQTWMMAGGRNQNWKTESSHHR